MASTPKWRPTCRRIAYVSISAWSCLTGLQGDAEDLPFATDSFDRYVSAGSIGEDTAQTRAGASVC